MKDLEQEAKEHQRQVGELEDEAASDLPDDEYTPSSPRSGNMEVGDDTLLQDLLDSLAKDPIRKPGDSGGERSGGEKRSEGGTVEASLTKKLRSMPHKALKMF